MKPFLISAGDGITVHLVTCVSACGQRRRQYDRSSSRILQGCRAPCRGIRRFSADSPRPWPRHPARLQCHYSNVQSTDHRKTKMPARETPSPALGASFRAPPRCTATGAIDHAAWRGGVNIQVLF